MKLLIKEPKVTCRLGQGEKCCAFLICSPEGFECGKSNNQVKSVIMGRLEKGEMNAKAQGAWNECLWNKVNVK